MERPHKVDVVGFNLIALPVIGRVDRLLSVIGDTMIKEKNYKQLKPITYQ